MRIHRFFLSEKIEGNSLKIKDQNVLHQWRNVFRYNVGSEIILFDGEGFEFRSLITSLNNREALVEVLSKKKGIVSNNKIFLYQSLIKKDKMEWVIEKAVELGIGKISPIISDRSEKKGFKSERAVKIATEASEQCGRADRIVFDEVCELEKRLNECKGEVIIFDKEGEDLNFSKSTENLNFPLNIFIGPEGGWADKEIELFKKSGAKIYSLGDLTLRSETASIVAIALLSDRLKHF